MEHPRQISWRDRYPDEVTCVRCLEVRPTEDLDRLLWCPACRRRAARRAQRWGWLGGGVLAAVLTLWIVLAVRPSRDLIVGGWVATVVAAFWIGSKVVREIAYGVDRYRNRRAVEAVPPAIPDDEDASSGGPVPPAG
ncbi:MAG: hypothetical protein PVI57_04750 [Gemmatimonadota bacterium]